MSKPRPLGVPGSFSENFSNALCLVPSDCACASPQSASQPVTPTAMNRRALCIRIPPRTRPYICTVQTYGKLQAMSTANRARLERGTLTREQILEAAGALLDREGLDGLTMRSLGQELGVGTMTLYGHFRSKDELLDALVDAATENEPGTASGPWRERLRELILSVRRSLVEHPARSSFGSSARSSARGPW